MQPTPDVFAPFGNSAVFSYHRVNSAIFSYCLVNSVINSYHPVKSAIVLNPVAAFSV